MPHLYYRTIIKLQLKKLWLKSFSWCRATSESKTKLLIFRPHRKLNITVPNIMLNNFILTPEKFVTYLGIEIKENLSWNKQIEILVKKSHTCEEGGPHLWISFCHLLMNFEKPEKSKFWRNGKKKCWRYHDFTHVYQKPQSYEVQFLRYRVKHVFFVILGHFLPFYPPRHLTTQKTKILKKWKKATGDVIILNLCNKKNNHMMYAYSEIWSATDIIFCHFRPIFALLPHYWPGKLKFEKNVKNTWRYYPFTHVYHKSRSYDVWFLRYKVQRTEFFVILGHFCHLTLLTTQKIKILKRLKKHLEISFYTCVLQMIIWCMVPEISSTTDIIFCHFGLFFHPPYTP